MQPRRRGKRRKQEYFYDYTLLFVVLILICFGLIMLYSVSSYQAYLTQDGDAAFYLKKQIGASAAGLLLVFCANFFDYHWLKKLAFPLYIFGIGTVLLLLTPLGNEINGATRWLDIKGLPSIQPAEIVKVTLIIFVALFICEIGPKIRTTKAFGIIVGLIAGIPAALLYFITSNLSSAIIVLGIAFLMCYVADPKYLKYIVAALIICVLAAGVVAYIVSVTGGETGEINYHFDRVLAWLNPEKYSRGDGFQTLQALYAIGSGGIWGKGLGQSMQKLGFLPEAQNDMVFSIICEELGLFGAFCLLTLFITMIWRMLYIANNAPDLFGALLVVGVMSHFAIQVILNVAVVTNTLPNTGVTLPFISYGGTSVLFSLAEVGIVLNVAKQIPME